MTFEEWWKETIAYQYLEHVNLFHKDTAKQLAHYAWETAQPKWTYCKDKLPDTEGNYLWLHEDKGITVEYYWTQIQISLIPNVIAWMPLPEVPNVHDD